MQNLDAVQPDRHRQSARFPAQTADRQRGPQRAVQQRRMQHEVARRLLLLRVQPQPAQCLVVGVVQFLEHAEAGTEREA